MPVYTTNPNPKRDFSPRPLVLPPPLLSLSNQVLYFYIPSQLWCPWLSRSTFLASICDATSQSVQQSDIMAPIRDGRSFTGFSAYCKAPELELYTVSYMQAVFEDAKVHQTLIAIRYTHKMSFCWSYIPCTVKCVP